MFGGFLLLFFTVVLIIYNTPSMALLTEAKLSKAKPEEEECGWEREAGATRQMQLFVHSTPLQQGRDPEAPCHVL